MDLVIETDNLQKRFGTKLAVADLTLAVPRGEVFAFLGPNGAGKSTSVKMLLGLVRPTGGRALLLGHAPGDPVAMARVGFVPEHFRFPEWLRAAEFLRLHARLARLPLARRSARIADVLQLVGLAEQADTPLASFSKGMLQRIGLAQALLHEPELVFLDEPTSALDPFGRMVVRQVIATLKAQGTTVFLNSHLLGEVEATADRAAFIRAGRVLQTIALGDLAAGRVQLVLRVDLVTEALLVALDALVPGGWQRSGTDTLRADLADEQLLPQIAAAVIGSGAQLYALVPQRRSLEQIFLDVVGEQDSGQ